MQEVKSALNEPIETFKIPIGELLNEKLSGSNLSTGNLRVFFASRKAAHMHNPIAKVGLQNRRKR